MALHKPCHTEVVKVLVDCLESCDQEVIHNVLIKQDKGYGMTALHKACYDGHSEIATTLLDLVEWLTIES